MTTDSEWFFLFGMLTFISVAAILHDTRDTWKYWIPDWLQEELIQLGFIQFGEACAANDDKESFFES